MIDVKKLITGFLILATAAVCSGLIFSLINFAPNNTTNVAPGVTIGAAPATTNAFLPTEDQVAQVAAALAPELASSTMFVSSTDPSNLTDDLAAEFVNGVVSANPSGPTGTDADGNPTFNSPDVNAIATNVADTTTTKNLSIPNWDVEAASIPVSVTTSSPAALTNYGTDVYNVLNSHLNAQVQAIASTDPTNGASASDLTYVESQMQSALQDVAALKVPAPAAAYQKSLLANLVYEKNMIQLNSMAQTDPVKASIIFEEEQSKLSSVQQNLLTQAQDLARTSLSLQQLPQQPRGNILLSFVNNTFGIPQAQAQWAVFDPATWSLIEANQFEDIATQIEGIVKNAILQILKNTLIALIQQKVLSWVQGSGAPRFITNWGTTLVNAAQQNAINYINSNITSGCSVYSAFAPKISVTLKAFYTPSTGGACANQFAAALGANSFQQFYNNFSNGGFVAFGASTLPSGNPYGAQFFEAQKTDLAFHNQQAATTLQTQTSQGFKGDQICDDGSNPSGNTTYCEDSTGVYDNSTSFGASSCPAGDKLVTLPNNGLCTDGTQPIVTTPSAVTAFSLQNTTGATTQQIAAANDIVGLLDSALSSLVLGLANAAVNSAGQLVSQSLTAINPSSITAGTATAASSSVALACNPVSQTIPASNGSPVATSTPSPTSTIPVSVSAIGGTFDSSGNPPTYYWASSNGATSTGGIFSNTFVNPGSYTITLTDSAGDTPATCTVIQQ